MAAIEPWWRVAVDVRGGIAEDCGHWIPEERPAWALEQLLAFFGEVGGDFIDPKARASRTRYFSRHVRW